MKINTVDNKITIIKNGVTMIDFAEPTYIPLYDSKDFVVTRRVIVSEEYDMRPDLLSFALYGTDDYTDVLLKINEYSNPLEVRSGDWIIVPAIKPSEKFYINPQKEEPNKLIDSKYLDPKKKSKQDSNRLAAMAKISQSVRNGSSANVRPNELKDSESNITTENGGINI